ncbi:MAG: hypothetical protein P1V20_23770, partial [Verrucomicrobiales bacterium]|nr:hypothetical protein [Verrucomicrobiales bacterium]
MRDRTYLLFERCYLVTFGLICVLGAALYFLFKVYVSVSGVNQLEWIIGAFILAIALMLMCIGMFGSENRVESWVDPFGTGDLFEFLVIGVAFT